MCRRALSILLIGVLAACGGDDAPAGPSLAVMSVAITYPSGSIFIASQTQFQATSTLSDGSTEPAQDAVWGTDTPGIATVSSTGVVTARAAGEATIFADVNPRGSVRIRVLPHFQGTWAGSERVTACEESGVFAGSLCGDFPVGTIFDHGSKFRQNDTAVDAEIIFADSTAKMSAGIGIDGLLALPTAPVLPEDPDVILETRNWRSRTDEPSRMTGSYEWYFTHRRSSGSARQVYELQNVTRSSTATSLGATRQLGGSKTDMLQRVRRQIERRLRQ